MTALTIALAQLEIEPGARNKNLERALEAIRAAADAGASLVCLPELFTVGYFSFDLYERTAEPLDGKTLTAIKKAAADNDIAVLAGSIVESLTATPTAETPAEDGLANTAVLFDATGERILTYRKHHLFGYGSAEQDLLVPGERLEVATLGPFTVGVTTCYDLRFPELYRKLIERGADLICVPSAWPYPRIEHWQTLSRARAIENQCYLATINGTGHFESENATLLGRSTIYDPWGTPIASSGDDPTLVIETITQTEVESVRTSFPALADRRL